MRSYGQYCPIAKGAELIGDRWTLLIIRELLFGPVRFNEFERGMPGISRSVLANRLRRLERDGIIERAGDGEGYVKPLCLQGLSVISHRVLFRVTGLWAAAGPRDFEPGCPPAVRQAPRCRSEEVGVIPHPLRSAGS